MNLAITASGTGLTAIDALFNSGTLAFYEGPIPDNPETGTTGNTALVTFAFANPAFASPHYTSLQNIATAAFSTTSATPGATGVACFARAIASTYSTPLADYTVGMAWAPSTPVVIGQYVVSGANTYICTTAGTTAASGGPSGTGTKITDGTAVWTWNNTGSPDIMMATTALNSGVPVTVQSMTHALSAA